MGCTRYMLDFTGLAGSWRLDSLVKKIHGDPYFRVFINRLAKHDITWSCNCCNKNKMPQLGAQFREWFSIEPKRDGRANKTWYLSNFMALNMGEFTGRIKSCRFHFFLCNWVPQDEDVSNKIVTTHELPWTKKLETQGFLLRLLILNVNFAISERWFGTVRQQDTPWSSMIQWFIHHFHPPQTFRSHAKINWTNLRCEKEADWTSRTNGYAWN